MEDFARLPEGCISEILSFTTPLDTVRSSSVSKGFKSAADSDAIWEKFLPSDYQEIISRISDYIHQIPFNSINNNLSKKQLYFILSQSSFFIDGRSMSFSLDIKSGKKKYMMGSRELNIAWADNSWYWERKSDHNSRFSEVISLHNVFWLDIRGRIETGMLSERTNYAAYLVFNLEANSYGFELPSNSLIRFIDSETDNEAENRASTIVHFQAMDYNDFSGHLDDHHQIHRNFPKNRADGWMEVELGSFYNEHGDEGVVEARLMEIKYLYGKTGLIVEGIEFRPK